MTPKQFVQTKICVACQGEGSIRIDCCDGDCEFDWDEYEECSECGGSGYEEQIVTCDTGLPEVNPSA